MAHKSSKIAPFPGCMDKRPPATEGNAVPPNADPTKELRTFIEGLQEESRLARQQQEAAEEDRDRLAEEVRRLQMELEAANQARTKSARPAHKASAKFTRPALWLGHLAICAAAQTASSSFF